MYTDENHEGYHVDDVYGKVLVASEVKRARMEEMAYFRKMRVYELCEIEECYERTGNDPIKVRWVDTNKPNDEHAPNYRSMLVAREFKINDKPELYSATPPIEWVKMIVAKVAEAQWDKEKWQQGYRRKYGQQEIVILYSDISRAYFNAKKKTQRQIH